MYSHPGEGVICWCTDGIPASRQRLVTCSWGELELKTSSQLMCVLCVDVEVLPSVLINVLVLAFFLGNTWCSARIESIRKHHRVSF